MSIRTYPFDEMDRFMEQFRHSMFDWPNVQAPGFLGRFTDLNVNLEETDDGYVCYADLPGYEKDEIDLRFHDGVLTISSTHAAMEEDEHSMQRQRRSVTERVVVPGAVRTEDISATYRNGVLAVHLPTDDADTGLHITIE